jgi:hypothetical protein
MRSLFAVVGVILMCGAPAAGTEATSAALGVELTCPLAASYFESSWNGEGTNPQPIMIGPFEIPNPWCYDNCMTGYGLDPWGMCSGDSGITTCGLCLGCCDHQYFCLMDCGMPWGWAFQIWHLCFTPCLRDYQDCPFQPTFPGAGS